MRIIVLTLVALLLAWAAVSVVGAVEYRGVVPDLLLIYVIFLAMHFPLESALVMAGSLGILKDLGSGLPLGTFAFLFTLAALLTAFARNYLFKQNILVQALIGFAAAFLVHGACGAALVLGGHGFSWGAAMAHALTIATYTAMCTPILLFIFRRFLLRLLPRAARGR